MHLPLTKRDFNSNRCPTRPAGFFISAVEPSDFLRVNLNGNQAITDVLLSTRRRYLMIKSKSSDVTLKEIVEELVTKYDCHTVILYGSRARGAETINSDYDVTGVRRSGGKLRLAEKRPGYFLDGFIFPERDLKKLGEQHFYMKDAKVIYQKETYGSSFIRRLQDGLKKPFVPLPSDEIKARRAWSHKMLERVIRGDIEALYRRSWLQMALLEDYFAIRQKRYHGSKEAFSWLQKNDNSTFKKFEASLKDPQSLRKLRSLVVAVSEMKSEIIVK